MASAADAREATRTAGGRGFAETFARFAEAPAIDDDLLGQAEAAAAAGPSPDIAPLAALALESARDGRRVEALGFAAEALAKTREGAERECERAFLAAALSARDRRALEGLFDATSGWSPDAPFGLASLILFVELARACEPWCVERLKQAGRLAPAPLRHAALVCRMSIGARVGMEPADFAQLAGEIIDDPEAGGALGRRLAIFGQSQGDSRFAAAMLERFPALLRAATREAIVAALLSEVAGSRLSDEAKRLADRFARTVEASRAFWRRIGAPSVRVAVVGSSPCALGLGLGGLIDAHDVVVRFNDSPEDGSFADDYGARCDVKMLNKPKSKLWARRTAARVVVTRRRHALGRTGALADELEALGKSLVFTSAGANQRLYAELGRLPTSGLLFLASLREARGSLEGASTFGFSFLDMLEGPRGAHYFGAKSPGRHDWAAERAIYDAWTGGGTPPARD